jgi:hypothetical protein
MTATLRERILEMSLVGGGIEINTSGTGRVI